MNTWQQNTTDVWKLERRAMRAPGTTPTFRWRDVHVRRRDAGSWRVVGM
jgi:hypothetical protein